MCAKCIPIFCCSGTVRFSNLYWDDSMFPSKSTTKNEYLKKYVSITE